MIRTLLTVLVLTVLSTPVLGEWKEVSESVDGTTFYVDFERIRKHDGYVYYWTLDDLLKPKKGGILSLKTYHQGDCKLFRYSYLSIATSKEPMGEGIPSVHNYPNIDWNYPSPNSSGETILKSVCKYAK